LRCLVKHRIIRTYAKSGQLVQKNYRKSSGANTENLLNGWPASRKHLLSNVLPKTVRPLIMAEEEKVSDILWRSFGIRAIAELNGKRQR